MFCVPKNILNTPLSCICVGNEGGKTLDKTCGIHAIYIVKQVIKCRFQNRFLKRYLKPKSLAKADLLSSKQDIYLNLKSLADLLLRYCVILSFS